MCLIGIIWHPLCISLVRVSEGSWLHPTVSIICVRQPCPTGELKKRGSVYECGECMDWLWHCYLVSLATPTSRASAPSTIAASSSAVQDSSILLPRPWGEDVEATNANTNPEPGQHRGRPECPVSHAYTLYQPSHFFQHPAVIINTLDSPVLSTVIVCKCVVSPSSSWGYLCRSPASGCQTVWDQGGSEWISLIYPQRRAFPSQ